MRIANRALKTEIMSVEGLASIDDVYTILDAARRFGVARNTVARWSDLGIFVAREIQFGDKIYRYYTRAQCDMFEQSDFYKNMPKGAKKMYAKVSATIHDFLVDDEPVIFTPAEFAAKIGLSVQSVNRMDRNGQLVARRVSHNNRVYRYYTLSQYEKFVNSVTYKELSHVKNADIIGKRFGKLVVLSYSEAAVKKGYYGSYTCRCDCGNIVDIPRSELFDGKVRSCGCKFHDLSGLTFGLWHVDSLADFGETTNGQKVFRYNCTCECGTKSVVFASSLRDGSSSSCGCRTEPAGEMYIRQYLNSIGLHPFDGTSDNGYKQHKTYDDLRGTGGKRLSYDFYVVYNRKSWLIEYQGQQHYYSVDYFGGESKFLIQQEHDNKKREYAEKIGVPLIEISYEYSTYREIEKLLRSYGIS